MSECWGQAAQLWFAADEDPHEFRTEVAAILYALIESAKLVGVDPSAYLLAATTACLRGDQAPLPHEFVAS